MNRKRLFLVGAAALIIAALVSLKILDVVRHSTVSAGVAETKVVVAARDLNVGQKITDADVRVVAMPTALVPDKDSIFNTTPGVVDHTVIVPMLANEIVTNSKVTGTNKGAGLQTVINSGMRAVSVKVNDVVSVAGFVGPGTHVDVIVTTTPPNGSEPSTTTVLQNVKVLAAGKEVRPDKDGKPQDVPVITLEVSPDDAQLLTLAGAEGRIQLALRNPTDVETKPTKPVGKAALYGAVAPVPAPRMARAHAVKAVKPPVAEVHSVEIIRGDKREVTKFER